MLNTKVFIFIKSEFTTTISLELINMVAKLIFNQGFELGEMLESI